MGHFEAVFVSYDPEGICYETLLNVYFDHIDLTRDEEQFDDVGPQYCPVIFYHTQKQKELAQGYKDHLMASKLFSRMKVQILPTETFYPARRGLFRSKRILGVLRTGVFFKNSLKSSFCFKGGRKCSK